MSAGRSSSRQRDFRREGVVVPATSVEPRSGALGHAEALTALALDAHARGLAGLGVDQHHVGDMDRALALDHATDRLGALRVAHLARTRMALDHVQPLDVEALLLGL